MKQNELNLFLNSYLNFRNNLSKLIKDHKTNYFNDCYLIEESWVNILEKYKIIVYNQKEHLFSNITFPEKDPLFINDFASALNLIQNNKKFKLIDKSLIEYLYENNYLMLKNKSCVLTFCSNNKLIIDFQRQNEDKSLLIEEPINHINMKDNIYIIRKNIQLYKFILAEMKSIKFSDYEEYLIPLGRYINSSSNLNKNKYENNNENKSLKNLIKFLVYLYYYDKNLLYLEEISFE